jgi:predicted AlkP superfamily pyrophosphatase or phosphodiesterase
MSSMSRLRYVGLLTVALVLLVGLPGISAVGADSKPEPVRPRLAVLIYFDQLRGDYLSRWDKLFEADGFRRLEIDGAWFQNCHYPYACTFTAAGHASVATGCSPAEHGVIGNEWFDRKAEGILNCVFSERYEPVTSERKGPAKKNRGVSPERLLQPTLADALKEATDGKGKVVALSFKDRSAVLPGGRRPDASYWFDSASGQFVTSTYYRDRVHSWVDDYNRGHPADAWFGKNWSRLRPELDYERHSGPDDTTGEGRGVSQGRTFPHAMDGGDERLTSAYYGALYNSPFGNELLLGLAKRAIDAEKLGMRETPDLLCISFSCNDPVGHTWGPDSQEVLDVTLRADRVVKELLTYLDLKVGKGKYVVAVTADHGVCPLPEVSVKQGRIADRISMSSVAQAATKHLSEQFADGQKENWIEASSGPWLYLNHAVLNRRKVTSPEVEAALAAWLRKQDGVQEAYTRSQFKKGIAEGDVIGQMAARSFYPDRSGDVLLILKPYHLFSSPLGTGTTHGTPHPYDTHVPLLVLGPGIRPGARKDKVTPQATASILARCLGIKPPAGATFPVPERLFEIESK